MAGWALAGLLGLGIFLHLYDRAFPEAAIHFTKSRNEILTDARRFLHAQHLSVNGYQESLMFTDDANARIFLERTLGLSAANTLIHTHVKVWAWNGRWFRPLHKEEFQASIAPDGELIGYTHLIEEAASGAWLEPEAAERLAVQWLGQHAGVTLSGYPLIDEDHTERPHRMDHTFVWEEPGFDVQGATYRIRVSVAGDQVIEFAKFLKVPERWIQQYRQEQSKGYVTTVLLTGGYGLLWIAILWVFLRALKHRFSKWRVAIVVAAGVALVRILSDLNAWPLIKHGFQTTQAIGNAYVWTVTQALLSGCTTAVSLGITAIAGWFLARRVWGNRPAAQLAPPLTPRGIRALFQSTLVGYGLAGVHLAYVSVFYLASFHWGAWAPSDTTRYENSFGTWLPWLFPLTVGLSASLNEELTFRLFGITLCQQAVRRRWLAVLLPGLLWAFLHSAYPQHPFFIRGIELTLPAIASGIIFLRFGILATIIWHYAYDAFLVALPLLRSPSPYFATSGWLVVTALALLPLGVWLLMVIRQRVRLNRLVAVPPFVKGGCGGIFSPWTQRQIPLRPLALKTSRGRPSGRAEGTSIRPSARIMERFFEPGRTVRIAPRWLLLITLAVFGLTAELLSLQSLWADRRMAMEIGRVDVTITRAQALSIARTTLLSHRVNLAGWRPAIHVDTEDWDWEMRYLSPRLGRRAAREFLFRELPPRSRWHIVWIRPGVRESYDVWLRMDGTLEDLGHTLPEETPGHPLPVAAARHMARELLHDRKGLDLAHWRLVDTTSETLPHRVDHTFTWEQRGGPLRKGVDGEASLRVDLTISGAEWTSFSKYLQLPEAWIRQQEAQRLRQTVAWSLSVCLGALCCLILGWRMVRYLRHGRLQWRTGVVVGSVTSVAILLSHWNEWPNFFEGYPASLSVFGFTAVKVIGWLRDTGVVFVVMVALGAFVEGIFLEAFPRQGGLWAQMRRLRQGPVSFRGWVASGCSLSLLVLAWLGISQGYQWVAQHLVPETSGSVFVWVTPRIAAASPALSIVITTLIVTLGGVLCWMLAVSLLTLMNQRWPKATVMLVGGGLGINALSATTWVQVGLWLGAALVATYVLWVGSRLLVEQHVGVVAAWLAAFITLEETLPLFGYHHPAYWIQGAVALFVGLTPCVWLGASALQLSQRFPHMRAREVWSPVAVGSGSRGV